MSKRIKSEIIGFMNDQAMAHFIEYFDKKRIIFVNWAANELEIKKA